MRKNQTTEEYSCLGSEMWVLRDGLHMAVEVNISNLQVELDAGLVVDVTNSKSDLNHPLRALFCDCKIVMAQYNVREICSARWESN